MQDLDAQTDDHPASGSSSIDDLLSENAGRSETPEAGARIAESTDIMDVEFVQLEHTPGMNSPGLELSSIWNEDELQKTPPVYERDLDPGVEFYERSSSPTPSYVKVFGAYSCTCTGCEAQAKANPHYPPSVREEKLKLYREWQEKRRQKWREQERQNKLAMIQDHTLRRERAILVVARALNLSESESERWKAESYERWHERMMKEIEARYPVLY